MSSSSDFLAVDDRHRHHHHNHQIHLPPLPLPLPPPPPPPPLQNQEVPFQNINEIEFLDTQESLVQRFTILLDKLDRLSPRASDQLSKSINEITSLRDALPNLITSFVDEPGDALPRLIQLYEQTEKCIARYNSLKARMDKKIERKHRKKKDTALNGLADGEEHSSIDRQKDEMIITQSESSDGDEESSSNQNEGGMEGIQAARRREPIEPEKGAPFSCLICFDDFNDSIKDGYTIQPCFHCYCKQCLREYLKQKIQDGDVMKLKCPDPRCQTPLEYHHISSLVDSDLLQKYETFSLRMALKEDPNARWCPRPGCNNCIIGDPQIPKIHCDAPDCNTDICFNCSQVWHPGQDCATVSKVDKSFHKWKKKHKTKLCPNCNAVIIKTAGCNHMVCSSCRYEFCWICKQKYTSTHFTQGECAGRQFPRSEKMKAIGILSGLALTALLLLPFVLVAAIIVLPIYCIFRLVRCLGKMKRKSSHSRAF